MIDPGWRQRVMGIENLQRGFFSEGLVNISTRQGANLRSRNRFLCFSVLTTAMRI